MATSTVTTPKRKTLAPATTPSISEEAKVQGKVVHLLDQLGNTIRDWRKTLAAKGVRGDLNGANSCVLAVYFTEGLGDPYRVSVGGGDDISIRRGGTPLGTVRLPARVVGQVRRFINNYDELRYPELTNGHSGCQCDSCRKMRGNG